MKMKRIALAAALAALCLCGCSSADAKKERTEITVLAAASLTESCEDIEKIYEAEHSGTDLVFSFGGSGALQIQIEEGAPADIFLSAGKKQMDALVDEKLVDSSSVNDLLENKVVLIVPEGSMAEISGFEDVISDKVGVIALGEPSSVPVGQYSEEIFGYYGILDEVRAKASCGSDVKQVLSWVETGDADCGVVYSTDAQNGKNIKVAAEAPEESHSRIIYQAGIVASTAHEKEAEEFMKFLSSDECSDVFAGYGFSPVGGAD